MVEELSAKEAAARLAGPDAPELIDVREPMEHRIACIDGAQLMPLSEAQTWLNTLDPAKAYVFVCHSGIRSMNVAQYLKRQGFDRVYNLRGGIQAWSLEVDPSVPRY
jgi:rhodanese-related sulfurtransferase